jgi:thymidylate synthase ThyX
MPPRRPQPLKSNVRTTQFDSRFESRYLPTRVICAEGPISIFVFRISFARPTDVKSLSTVATQSRMFHSENPGELVESAPPRVTLRNAFAHPFDSAIAAARTCYSSRLIGPEEITDKQRLNIGAGTFFSGHHTVYQHAHFEFGLENVSRQFVWSFLHAHPFYNSEQQSQRYVRMDRVQAYVPSGSLFFDAESRLIYERAIARAWSYYRELSSLLLPDAREILQDIWHVGPMSHPKRIQKIERSSEKRSIEIARYVLPVAAFSAMVHTVSGIVLHRLWRMCAASDTPSEARAVIGDMVAHVKNIDAQFFDRFGIEPLDELPEWRATAGGRAQNSSTNGDAFAKEFDAQLNGRTAKLLDYSANAPVVIAASYRAVLGLSADECTDAEALDRLLNPARNLYRLETLNVGVHAPMMRALQHANYTFAKKISHTADSQDQRHRMIPGSRPLLTLADTREPDYITPALLKNNSRAKEVYDRAMQDAWHSKNQLLDRGVPLEIALYLLPNAKSIRLVETGSLLHLLHKWTMRTCFNAQEEIYQSSLDEISQLCEVHPQLTKFIGPPCHLRAGVTTPICTEGSHFCGVKVWLDFPNVTRRI